MSRRKRDEAAPLVSRVAVCAREPPSPRTLELLRLLRQGPYCVEVANQPGRSEAEIVVWTPDRVRAEPMPAGAVLNVLDLRGVAPEPGLVRAGAKAGLLLVGSEADQGAWSTLVQGVPVAVVPPTVMPSAEPVDAFRSLCIVAGRDPSPETVRAAERAAAWAKGRDLPCGVADAVAAGLGLVDRIGRAPAAASGAVVLDARAAGELPAMPDALIEAIAAGAPVLCCGGAALPAGLERAGAVLIPDELEAGLDAFAALPGPCLREMSVAALAFVRQRFGLEPAGLALSRALTGALARTRRRAAAWMREQPGLGPGCHVLVISDEALNLLDIRVHLPFGALLRRGAISGYAVLRHGEFIFGSAPVTPHTRFDAVWVQRSADPAVQLLLQVLDRPFIYDLDDNLLVSPSYRDAFPAESVETARALIRACTVLSCATPRLARLLQAHGGDGAVEKAVVTPNLADGRARQAAGQPRAVVWASSDKPALAGSRPEVERAVRDFCLAHRLPLVCVGAEPPPVFAECGLEIEHVGLVSYAAYLARLRQSAPGILVGPLETGADPQTQDFVDAKSDVKVIEARLAGLVGVFSRAAPYAESDLAPAILCDNTYTSWLEGLERAHRRCERGDPAAPWPARRSADQLGPMPWAEALRRGRSGTDLAAREVTEAVRFVRAQQETLLVAPGLFDEADYLGRHADVRQAVAAGVVASGYRHFVESGFREGRAARRRPTAEAASALWWARLLHTVSRVEAEVQAREREIETLRDRMALRRPRPDRPALPRKAPAPAPPPAGSGLHWHPEGEVDEPCPVCDAAGPHRLLLRAETEGLARCAKCGACFYERRVPYPYERAEDTEALLQLYLEQNAGIYHQTRPLFAPERADSVLDVGCGFGYAVDLAASTLGWRAAGIDPSVYAGEGAAQLGADIRQAYLTEETDLGARFSLVMASEVIEHVPDPHAFLALLRRWLEPGGTLVLTTPDAGALAPGLDPARLTGMLALRVHLILFTRDALALALSRAGFRHVQVEAGEDTLLAYASDRPLRLREDAAERHVEAYRRYLERLLDRAEPGTALWNGAAGRLLALLAGTAEPPLLHGLFARIAAAWRERFGIDLARLRLPEILSERALAATTAASLAAREPLNLAGVLLSRALLEQRTPGRTPEAVLAYARPAYLHAVQTGRILQAGNMIDLDLKLTAWRARMLIIDCLAELAPEVEGELLLGLAEPSPGGLREWTDPPAEALGARIAPYFAAAVQADRFDDARRVEPWMRDLDLLCRSLREQPERRLRALFTAGVQRLLAAGDPAAALEAFERLEAEARLLLGQPGREALARDFLRVALEHIRLAAARLET